MLITYTCGGQKSWQRANMLITYSSGGQTSMECAYMRITYTCGELKSSGRAYMLIVYTWVGKGLVYMLITYTCVGQKSSGRTYMQITYTYRGQKSWKCIFTLLAYTNAEWMSQGTAPGSSQKAFSHLWVPLAPFRAYYRVKITWKWVKSTKFHLPCQIA